MRYCGIDVSATPANQQLCTLHERRDGDGGVELVATFYDPGSVESVARTVIVLVPGTVGVPLTTQPAPSARPEGSEPPMMEQL